MAHLSNAQFEQMFKNFTGMTPRAFSLIADSSQRDAVLEDFRAKFLTQLNTPGLSLGAVLTGQEAKSMRLQESFDMAYLNRVVPEAERAKINETIRTNGHVRELLAQYPDAQGRALLDKIYIESVGLAAGGAFGIGASFNVSEVIPWLDTVSVGVINGMPGINFAKTWTFADRRGSLSVGVMGFSPFATATAKLFRITSGDTSAAYMGDLRDTMGHPITVGGIATVGGIHEGGFTPFGAVGATLEASKKEEVERKTLALGSYVDAMFDTFAAEKSFNKPLNIDAFKARMVANGAPQADVDAGFSGDENIAMITKIYQQIQWQCSRLGTIDEVLQRRAAIREGYTAYARTEMTRHLAHGGVLGMGVHFTGFVVGLVFVANMLLPVGPMFERVTDSRRRADDQGHQYVESGLTEQPIPLSAVGLSVGEYQGNRVLRIPKNGAVDRISAGSDVEFAQDSGFFYLSAANTAASLSRMQVITNRENDHQENILVIGDKQLNRIGTDRVSGRQLVFPQEYQQDISHSIEERLLGASA